MGFCPVCGADIPRGQTFCDVHQPVKLDVKPFDIRVCECGRMFSNNHWFVPHSVEESALRIARRSTKQKASFTIVDFVIPEKRGKQTKGKMIATFNGEEFPVEFKIKNQQCDKCSKLGTHYFTAKLQLRNPPEGSLEFVEEFLQPHIEKGVSINKVEDTPRGPDLFMTHKSFARQLGEKLVRKFGGTCNSSEQLFSRNKQTSKDLFRLHVVVEFARFTVGDVVLLDEKIVLVTGLNKQCTGRHLEFDKKVVFTAGDEEEVLQPQKTTVAITHPHIAVIHPETFQQVVISNHLNLVPEVVVGQKVKVVVFKNKVFLV